MAYEDHGGVLELILQQRETSLITTSWHAKHESERRPMGVRDEVAAAITRAFPDVQWQEQPPKLDSPLYSDPRIRARLQRMPDELRSGLSKPFLTGGCSKLDGSAVRFVGLEGFGDDPLDCVIVAVSGDGNPMPRIVRMCRDNGWSLSIEEPDSHIGIDPDDRKTPEWAAYQNWRDRLIGELQMLAEPE